MSKGKQKQQVVDTSPWKPAQPHWMNIFNRADPLSQGTGISPQTSMFQNRFMNEALRSDPLTDQAGSFLSKTMSGGFSNPYASEALGDAMDMAKARINAQFAGDNSGSSTHKEWLGRGITQAALPFASNLFESDMGRRMQAAGMAPGIGQANMARLGQGLQVSQGIDQAPWDQLQRYGSLLGMAGGGSTSQPMQKANPLGSALGGGLAGAGIASALPAAWGITGPMGLGIGAALGLLGGL